MRAVVAFRKCTSALPALQTRCLTGGIELPDLAYDYGALEPKISGQIMELHHSKHHATYVAGYNTAVSKFLEAKEANDVNKMNEIQKALDFHGGGHRNHSLFWKSLCPAKDYEPPSGELLSAIEKQLGGLEKLKGKMNADAAAIQGSGWAWLGVNPVDKSLSISATPNQGILENQGLQPLLGIDMWEHAYYLQYKNVKADYLKAIWNVIDWREVSKRYAETR